MSQAKNGDTVRIHYTGKLGDGTTFDSSEGRDPLEFTLGAGQVIPGFEKGAEGLEVGEQSSFTVPKEDAYGERDPGLTHQVPRAEIPDEIVLQKGLQLQARSPDGQTVVLTVVDFDDDTVTLDANHPLAGHDLTFDIKLVEIVNS